MSCPHGNPIGGCDTCDEVDAAFEAGKRSALAEQPAQQEPKKDLMYSTVAMQERHAAFVDRAVATLEQAKREALAEQPAQQEPVAWLDPWTRNNVTTDYDAYGKHGIPLYTSPPAQRKPLTRKQLADAWIGTAHITHATERQIAYARAVEAAHGIKENT